MNLLLIGHRASGKTTLAGRLKTLMPDLEVIDLDATIAHHEKRACATLVAQDEPRFRQLEHHHLRALLDSPHPPHLPYRLVVLGAGCQDIPPDALTIWLERDGWIESATTERQRLRPELPFEQEIAWMQQTRAPRFARAAHTKLHIARGDSIAYATQRLARHVSWLLLAPYSPTTHATYLVPSEHAQLDRALHTAQILGMAGVELRSDLLPITALQHARHTLRAPILASLRSKDPHWLHDALRCDAIDIDVNYLHLFTDNLAVSSQKAPSLVILSSHPPAEEPWREALDALLEGAAKLSAYLPEITLKLAPTLHDYSEVMALLDHMEGLAKQWPITLLPQGEAMAWMRPWLAARLNATHYIPAQLNARRLGPDAASVATQGAAPLDLQDWLPSLAGPVAPTQFDALLGDPAWPSVGDEWHCAANLKEGDITRGYLKVELPRDITDAALHDALKLFARLELRGLSITSPHKERLARAVGSELEALNTLRREAQGWRGCDTDEVGMAAALGALETAGVEPGAVAIMGRGGVSPALTRAIAQRPGWHLATHASARQGWSSEERATRYVVIVNASGDADAPYDAPPDSEAWVDLHYRGVRAPPAGRPHLNGASFFEAQASAQRAFWRNGESIT